MSASSKKKLRKEQNTAQLTERQIAEQQEAKKLKLYTTLFVTAVAVMLVAAIIFGVSTFVTGSGMKEKNTVAVTVGQHDISNAELNYFYIDSVNNYYSQYGQYISLFGLDATKPLNEQFYNEEAGQTWADYFVESATNSAQSVYALNDAAAAEGFTMGEAETAQIESTISTIEMYATLSGYQSADTYLKAMYGNGASMKTYRAYLEKSMLADAYYTAHADSLTYDDAALREVDAADPAAFSAYSYNYYYLAASKFEDSEDKIAAAKAAAESLTENVTTAEELDAAIAALSINEGTEASSTACNDYNYANVNTSYVEWITAAERKVGDITVIPSETDEINGYYVVLFRGSNDNTYALKNVRHILVSFEHNHVEGEEHDHTEVTYTEEEIAAAKAEAEEILAQWKSGEATEDSFAALANEKSDDGDGTTGGLYEEIFKGQMVAAFQDWCFDASRTAGDTGIVETEYGFHVMYFVGDSETNYRDYLIRNQLKSEDLDAWYTGLVDAMVLTAGNTDYMPKDMVLAAG